MTILWKNERFCIKPGIDRYEKECFLVCFLDEQPTGKYFYSLQKAERRAKGWTARGTGPCEKPAVDVLEESDVVVGLFSDTHDQEDLIDSAIRIFVEQECDAVIHCGDFEEESSLEHIVQSLGDTPLYWVAGNHDSDWAYDCDLSEKISMGDGEFGEFDLFGFRIGLAHGTYSKNAANSQQRIRDWIAAGTHDFVFYGHFHQFNIRFGSPFVIDPGGFYRRESNRYRMPRTMTILNLTRKLSKLFVWNENDGGFEEVGTIELATRKFHVGVGLDTWRDEASEWSEKSIDWTEWGKVFGENWAQASRHVDENAPVWISHDALMEGDERV